jgi:putative sugar O-methyltransferase
MKHLILNTLTRFNLRLTKIPTAKQSELYLPNGAREYLRHDNPRLIELKGSYSSHPAIKHSQWSENGNYLKRELSDLARFRADNAYLYQGRCADEAKYLLSAYYIKDTDKLGLLDKLTDDSLFGNETYDFDGHIISRDLLDSIIEIDLLESIFNFAERETFTLLDIGAGYGRLAHRLNEAFPSLKVLATDGVAESTFISEYYLRFRASRARVIPLSEVEDKLSGESVDCVTNIHSFSEMPMQSIRYWISLIRERGVKHLLIAPNDTRFLSTERDGQRIDFLPFIESQGYKLVKTLPKYSIESVQRCGAFPATYFLFSL